jgi:hypothetical protein
MLPVTRVLEQLLHPHHFACFGRPEPSKEPHHHTQCTATGAQPTRCGPVKLFVEAAQGACGEKMGWDGVAGHRLGGMSAGELGGGQPRHITGRLDRLSAPARLLLPATSANRAQARATATATSLRIVSVPASLGIAAGGQAGVPNGPERRHPRFNRHTAKVALRGNKIVALAKRDGSEAVLIQPSVGRSSGSWWGSGHGMSAAGAPGLSGTGPAWDAPRP